MKLILASTSPYRRELLGRLGVAFTCEKPDCDEDAWKTKGLDPAALAETLAHEKAKSVAAHHPDAAVIGSDQLLELDGQVLGKAGTPDRAVAQLLSLSGRKHRLITAMALISRTKEFRHTDVTEVTFRPLTKAQCERYVAEENPVDCAGSYKFESGGIRLFHTLDTDDPTAIIGLPLLRLGDWLTLLGFPFP